MTSLAAAISDDPTRARPALRTPFGDPYDDDPPRSGLGAGGGGGLGGRPAPAYPFEAALDVSELDDRDRPGPAWGARSTELSRRHITIRTRRMCYVGRKVRVLIHLIDDEPAVLVGCVRQCEYDAEGRYRVRVDFLPRPDARAGGSPGGPARAAA